MVDTQISLFTDDTLPFDFGVSDAPSSDCKIEWEDPDEPEQQTPLEKSSSCQLSREDSIKSEDSHTSSHSEREGTVEAGHIEICHLSQPTRKTSGFLQTTLSLFTSASKSMTDLHNEHTPSKREIELSEALKFYNTKLEQWSAESSSECDFSLSLPDREQIDQLGLKLDGLDSDVKCLLNQLENLSDGLIQLMQVQCDVMEGVSALTIQPSALAAAMRTAQPLSEKCNRRRRKRSDDGSSGGFKLRQSGVSSKLNVLKSLSSFMRYKYDRVSTDQESPDGFQSPSSLDSQPSPGLKKVLSAEPSSSDRTGIIEVISEDSEEKSCEEIVDQEDESEDMEEKEDTPKDNSEAFTESCIMFEQFLYQFHTNLKELNHKNQSVQILLHSTLKNEMKEAMECRKRALNSLNVFEDWVVRLHNECQIDSTDSTSIAAIKSPKDDSNPISVDTPDSDGSPSAAGNTDSNHHKTSGKMSSRWANIFGSLRAGISAVTTSDVTTTEDGKHELVSDNDISCPITNDIIPNSPTNCSVFQTCIENHKYCHLCMEKFRDIVTLIELKRNTEIRDHMKSVASQPSVI